MILDRIRETTRLMGITNGLLYLVGRAMEVVSHGRWRIIKYVFVAQPVAGKAPAGNSRPSAISIVGVVAGDPLLAEFPRPKAVIDRRFGDGAVCLAAVKGGELAGFLWLQADQYLEDEVRCLYLLDPPGAALWDYDVYVTPAYRLGRTFSRLWSAAHDYMAERGHAWSLSRISAFNPMSLASHARLGAVRLGTAIFVVLGGVQLSLFSCRPYFHLGGTSAIPRIRLRAPQSPAR